jgi:3-deoxy-D-manno-octulosonate 8-phosphate phosphatase (KDO 8-P phosphatase)
MRRVRRGARERSTRDRAQDSRRGGGSYDSRVSRRLAAKLAGVRLFLCDVDGILTDATVVMGGGAEYKVFNVQDGLGLRLLQRCGIKVGWISARPSPATSQRAADLKVDFLHQSPGCKIVAVETLLRQAGARWEEVCYMGDDIVDLGVLKRAGVAVTVANAIPEAKALADYVTLTEGGRGAVREVVHLILRAQHQWERLVREYLA